MREDSGDIADLSPDRLMAGLTKTRLPLWIAVATAIHAVVIAAFSISYIRDTWVDPEGAAERKAAAEQRRKAAVESKREPVAPAASSPVAATARTDRDQSAGPQDEESRMMEARKDTPMVKRVTETPQPGEIPREPGQEGIRIEDTNPR